MLSTQETATDHTAARGTPGTPPPSVPSAPLPFHDSTPGPQIPPVIPLLPPPPPPHPTAVLPLSLSQQLVHPQPLSLWPAGGCEEGRRGWQADTSPPACLSGYLSPVFHKHIAIRNASALVRSCSSVNTSLLWYVWWISLCPSPSLSVSKPLAYTVQQSRTISGVQKREASGVKECALTMWLSHALRHPQHNGLLLWLSTVCVAPGWAECVVIPWCHHHAPWCMAPCGSVSAARHQKVDKNQFSKVLVLQRRSSFLTCFKKEKNNLILNSKNSTFIISKCFWKITEYSEV